MKTALKRLVCSAVALSGIVAGSNGWAGTLTNNFTDSFDYVANGIIGDTNWDGVYLGAGDIVGGTGTGRTIAADANNSFFGFLTVQGTGGAWIGPNQNDSFYIYKVVSGDFDASVEIMPPFSNPNYHLPGLLVRAYNTNNSGMAYSATSTNGGENWMYIARFQEFSISAHGRYTTNGTDHDGFFNTPGDNSDTNTSRYFRITRVGNTFSFYEKTNQSDGWFLASTLDRSDLDGVPIQVGIKDESGTGNSPTTYFTDFELSGPNVTFSAMPPAPSALVSTATNIGGSLTLSWTKGNPADNSLVVVRRGRIQHNPIPGVSYVANSAYGDTNTLLGGAGEFVVYNGAGNSVTVTNLGANNLTYTVAVYEYSGSGASTVYNTASPATNAFAGPGVINGVTLVAASTNIPINGAAALKLLATFSTGEVGVDQTTNATWQSSDPTIVAVDGSGVVSGVAPGTATITATFGAFAPTVDITVHTPPTFTDLFTSTHDYIANGLVGTPWDGLFLNFGDVPGAVAGNDGVGSTLVMDSQITTTNGLYLSSVQSDWQGNNNDGPFLYKLVPGSINGVSGDFEAILHINNMNTLNGSLAGLMARLFNPANHGPGPNNREYHVNYWKVQNGTTSVRRTQNGGNTTIVAAGPAAADGWLMIQRVGSTNFNFFEKAGTNDLWTLVTSTVLAAASNNAPMEVGIAQQSTAGVNGIATFDSFVLDAAGINSGTPPPAPASNLVMTLNGDLSVTINYTVFGTNADGSAIRSIVVMRDGGPVTAQPYTGLGLAGNSVFGDPNNSLGDGNYVVFRSAFGDTNLNQSVTVTGLTPGHTYYAAVYTFIGLGATRTFNNDASTASGHIQDGILESLEVLPTPPIPAGGIGQMQVIGHYTGGATINVSPFATITSGDTNVIKVLNGILTGISTGTANVTLVYSGLTNVAAVSVRPPMFKDEFNVNHDYLVSGVAGSGWDGSYNPNPLTNPIPGSIYVPLAGSGASVADANVSSNGLLTISAAGDGWENGNSGGFFLFKYVPADFQTAVHIQSFDVANYNQPGLLARAYGFTNGIPGTPFGYVVTNANGTNDAGEYWVSLTRFDEFNIGTYARRNIDSGVSQNTQTDQGDTNYWLLIVRSGTEFDFYKRLNATDPWKQVPNKTHYSISQFAGQPMQVGLMAGPWNGGSGSPLTVRFEHFMLDQGAPILQVASSGSNALLTWNAQSGFSLEYTVSLNPANWQPISGTPVATNGALVTVSIPMTNTTSFFRLVQ